MGTLYHHNDRCTLHCGDSLEVLKGLEENSADSGALDPPSGTGFMGEDWDGDKGGRDAWIDWLSSILYESMRVLKPGAHVVVWALPRTSHWTGMALEEAGFEVRDSIHHCFATGFPKNTRLTRFIGDEWEGFGTAIKPAHEVWWLARVPLSESSIAANAERWGTGALNVDACRVACSNKRPFPEGTRSTTENVYGGGRGLHEGRERGGDDNPEGRWPPNQIFSHSMFCEPGRCVDRCPVQQLDAMSGFSRSAKVRKPDERVQENATSFGEGLGRSDGDNRYSDEGGASRFYPCFEPDLDDFFPLRYQPKPTSKEKCAGLEELPLKQSQKWNEGGIKEKRARKAEKAIENCQGLDARGRTLVREDGSKTLVERWIPGYSANNHPTVKSVKLMRWLCRLVTPPGGVVLDAFMGSGSTGCAAAAEGFGFVGIEKKPSFCEIAKGRLLHYQKKHPVQAPKHTLARRPDFQRSLF